MAEVTSKGRKRTAREIDLVDNTIIPSIATKNEGEIAVSAEPPPKVARKSKPKAVLAKTPVEGDCTICFENYKNDYAVLKCNHTYCFKCIKEWSETENSCPLCKSRFTSLDRYNIGEGQKAKKQRVKVGKKDQWQSYLRQMQNNGPTAQGVHQFTFFPVTNSTIGRQLLLNLIHSLHPNASFDDDDEEEEDDEDWVPRGNFNESEDESISGTQYDDQDDEEQIWIDLNRSGRVQARDEASAQPLINLVDDDDDDDDDCDRLYDEINRLDGTSNNNIGRNNNARRLEGIVSSSIRQRMRPVVDLTLDEDDDLIRTFTTSSNRSNNSSSVPNSFADTGVLLQDA